jgi:hypothetical protein
MRIALLTVGVIAAGLVVVAVLVDLDVPLPQVGMNVEPLCVETMRRSAPDLSWFAPGRESQIRRRPIKTVSLGELPLHRGQTVRVAGFLHVEFEWVALYPSRIAREDGWRAPWVALGSLWPDEPYWGTKGPSISGRCVAVEGTYSGGPGGHGGMFNGTIEPVVRLDVWSTPHRPVTTTPPSPPPPPPTRDR